MSGNVVTVYPGGATFSTIQAAIDSISGASATNPYQVEVGPGTYNESIKLKEYISVIGKDENMPPTAVITSDCTETGPPTVTGASNSTISALQLIANGNDYLSFVNAVRAQNTDYFKISGCLIIGKNTKTNGVRTVTVSIMGGSNTEIFDCQIENQVSGQTGSAQALSAWSSASLTVYNSTVTGNGAGGNGAAILSDGSGTKVTVQISNVSCPDWALWLQDGGAMTAVGCTVEHGKVSPGVKVENEGD